MEAACDERCWGLVQGQIQVSVNGSFEAPNGVVFEQPGGFEGEMFAGKAPASATSDLHSAFDSEGEAGLVRVQPRLIFRGWSQRGG